MALNFTHSGFARIFVFEAIGRNGLFKFSAVLLPALARLRVARWSVLQKANWAHFLFVALVELGPPFVVG